MIDSKCSIGLTIFMILHIMSHKSESCNEFDFCCIYICFYKRERTLWILCFLKYIFPYNKLSWLKSSRLKEQILNLWHWRHLDTSHFQPTSRETCFFLGHFWTATAANSLFDGTWKHRKASANSAPLLSPFLITQYRSVQGTVGERPGRTERERGRGGRQRRERGGSTQTQLKSTGGTDGCRWSLTAKIIFDNRPTYITESCCLHR